MRLHYYFYFVIGLALYVRNDVALDSLAVYGHRLNPLLGTVLFNGDMICAFAELSCDLEIAEVCGYARINGESFVGRIYAQDVLGDIYEGPSCGTGKPAVLALTVELSVTSCYHLAVDVRLSLVNLGDFFGVSRAGLLVDLESSVSTSHNGLCDRYPRVIVAEDSGVLLVSRGI